MARKVPASLAVQDPLRYRLMNFKENQTAFWGRFGVVQSSGSHYENGRDIPTPTALLLVLYEQGMLSDAELEQARAVVRASRQSIKAIL